MNLLFSLLVMHCSLDKENNSATPLRRSPRKPKFVVSPDYTGMAGGKKEHNKIGKSGGVYTGTLSMKKAPKSAW